MAQPSTLAPTEKHLEDWIVTNPTAFGDVFDDEGFDYRLGYEPYQFDKTRIVLPYINSIVARQYNLPTGRPDLLVYGNRCFSVVELKKGHITYDVIGQCLRYMFDLKNIFYHVFEDAIKTKEGKKTYYYPLTHSLNVGDIPQNEINGIVVGHEMQDKNITIVAASCGIQVVTYKYLGDKYEFEQQWSESASIANYKEYIKGPVGKTIRLMMYERAEVEKEIREHFAGLQS